MNHLPHITLIPNASGYSLATTLGGASAVAGPPTTHHGITFEGVQPPESHPDHGDPGPYFEPLAALAVTGIGLAAIGVAAAVKCRERFTFAVDYLD